MSVFYSPVLTRSLIFCSYELLCLSIEGISSDILTWSADSLYSEQ